MSSSQVSVFNFNGLNDVRTVTDGDVVWFATKDVCDILELSNVGQAVSRLDDDEKGVIILNDVTGRQQEMSTINESGLYSLVLSSRKPEAKAFKKWVTSSVLPTIRKTGKYDSATDPYLKHRDEVMGAYAEVKFLKETNEAKDKQIAAYKEYELFKRKTPEQRKKYEFNMQSLRQTPVFELDLDLSTPFETTVEIAVRFKVSDYTVKAAIFDCELANTDWTPNKKASGHYVIVDGIVFWNIKTALRCLIKKGDIRSDLVNKFKSECQIS